MLVSRVGIDSATSCAWWRCCLWPFCMPPFQHQLLWQFNPIIRQQIHLQIIEFFTVANPCKISTVQIWLV